VAHHNPHDPSLFADVAGLTRAVGFRDPEGESSCVVGIGAQLWDRIYGQARPAGLHPFQQLAGAAHTAASTPGGVLIRYGPDARICVSN
jgi:putative iron-dependent peroxidase